MVPEFAKLGAYFSFSGFLMSMKVQKAKKMLKAVSSSIALWCYLFLKIQRSYLHLWQVSSDRILLETDAPDALPNSEVGSLFLVGTDDPLHEGILSQGENSASNAGSLSDDHSHASKEEASTTPEGTLNHPANLHNVCLLCSSSSLSVSL